MSCDVGSGNFNRHVQREDGSWGCSFGLEVVYSAPDRAELLRKILDIDTNTGWRIAHNSDTDMFDAKPDASLPRGKIAFAPHTPS